MRLPFLQPGQLKNINLEIIAEGIETHKKNYTRFLILKGKNGDHQDVTQLTRHP